MNKTAFVISVVLTTFVLMVFGGVVYALRAEEVAATTAGAQETSAEVAPAADPSLEQTLLEREAIYQQRLAEANARLEQARQQLAAQRALASPQTNSQAALTPITPEQAAQIAADFLGVSDAYWVGVVSVQGEDVYLVTFTSGDGVYVNMAGQVIGSFPAQFSGGSGGGGGSKLISAGSSDDKGGSHGEHEGEHEGDDDHGSGGEDD
jgi:alanyl-tRNA synthetase